MIRTFKCKETESIWQGQTSRKLPIDIQNRALKKLRMIDVAIRVEDLRNPPSNHLENLRGDRENQKSVRINDQWRICFVWQDSKAYEIEIVDYHR